MGWSVGKIIKTILSLRVGTSKNKNIDHQGRKSCDYESDLIFLLRDSPMSSVLDFRFSYTLLQPKRKINGKKKNVYMRKQYYYFDLPKIRVGRARTTKN